MNGFRLFPPMQATYRSITIVILLLLASLLPVAFHDDAKPELDISPSEFSTIISTDTVWTGEVMVSDNLSISHGVTLTVKAGTFINITADVTIHVAGTLSVEDTVINSSLGPSGQGNSGTGVWHGIIVDAIGTLSMDNVSIANARTAITVSGTSTLTDVSVSQSYIGLDIDGLMTATDLSCLDLDFYCLKVSGTATVTGFSAINVSTAVAQSGLLEITDVQITDAGTGFDITGGSGGASQIAIDNASIGWRVRGTTAVFVDDCTSTGLATLLDAGASSGFSLSNFTGVADRVLRADGITDLTMADIIADASADDSTSLDVRNDGTLTLSDLTLTGYAMAMELTGDGDTTISDSMMSGADSGITASGSGTLTISDSVISSGGNIGDFSQISTSFTDSDFVGGNDSQSGLAWIGGTHVLTDVSITRTYIGAADTSSMGANGWWVDLTLDNVAFSGWHSSLECERCTLDGSGITMSDGGTSGGTGITLRDSGANFAEISSSHMTTAVSLEGESSLVVSTWSGQLHNTLVAVSENSIAHIRDIAIADMSGTIVYGDGTMYWGSSDVFTLAVSTSQQYIETSVNITDLEGNNVVATVNVGPWQESADGMNPVSLPLFASGSEVIASSGGAGAVVTLMGGVAGQSVQLPIIPAGDWVIASVDVILGATTDGSAHVLSGNLTITSGASLTLSDTTLELAGDKILSVESGAALIGDGGTVTGAQMITASGAGALGGIGDGLHLSSPTTIDCAATAVVSGVSIAATTTIASGCDYTITGGKVSGDVLTLASDSRLEVKNTLIVIIIDAGTPVAGATVSVGGTNYLTDAQGQAIAVATARLEVNGSDTVWYDAKYVQMTRGGHVQFYNWQLNDSLTHTFISSAVTSGVLSQALTLDAEWSPWYLNSQLTVPFGVTMTIRDNTEVVIADGVVITVEGLLDINSATLHSTSGSRWGGIAVLGTNSVLSTSGSHLVEARQIITVGHGATVTISGTEIARGDALLTISGDSSTSVENSYFHDAMESCVMAQGQTTSLSVRDSTFDACGDHAIWARHAILDLANIVLGNGSEEGLDFSATTGMVDGLDASAHQGEFAAVHLSEINGQMTLANLNLSAGISSAALVAQMSRNIEINGAYISGAPAMELDTVAGMVSGIQMVGDGTGTAIHANHSRGSGSLQVADSSITGYSVGIDLQGDSSEATNHRFVSTNNIIITQSSIICDGRNFVSIGDTLYGSISLTSEVALESELYDSTYGNISVGGNASLISWKTVSFIPTLDGVATSAQVTIPSPLPETFSTGDEEYISESSLNPTLIIPVAAYDASNSFSASQLTFSASAEGGLPYSETIWVQVDMDNIALPISFNSHPILQLIDPDGDLTIMETDNLTFSATANDADSNLSQLSVAWTITDSIGIVVVTSNDWQWSNDDLSVGTYVARVTVSDPHGGTATTSFVVTVTALDSDGDWIETCDQDLWWDATVGVDCGPDYLDDDDDNDGIDDILDAWPNDACASRDSDYDGMPDELRCPDGVTTTLIEDTDDDNDGILDVDALAGGGEDGTTMSMIAAVLLFIAIAALVINRLRKQN